MKRIKLGVKGLDELLQGGIPEQTSVLICGSPGTGKSILGLQYIYTGAKIGQPGVYVSIEEKPSKLREQAMMFFRDFDKLEKKNLIKFLKIPTDITDLDIIKLIKDAVKKIKAERLVIDSLSILSINASMYKIQLKAGFDKDVIFSRAELRPSSIGYSEETKQFIYIFITKLSELGLTTLFIADSPEQSGYLTRDTVSEFVCDGVIRLKQMVIGRTVQRVLEIVKMRNTDVKPGFHSLVFGKHGLEIVDFRY